MEDDDKSFTPLEWIVDEKKYQIIHKMAHDGKIANITLDTMDKKRYALLKKTLDKHNFTVGALYLSNIIDFQKENNGADFYNRKVTEKAEQTFWKNQLSLCNDRTLIVNAELHYGNEDYGIIVNTPQEIRRGFLNAQRNDIRI